MSRRRLIQIIGEPARAQARIYRDSEWNEYRTVFYMAGTVIGTAHTDDKQDAIDTAKAELARMEATK